MADKAKLPALVNSAGQPLRAEVASTGDQSYRAGDVMSQEMARWRPSPGAPDAEFLPSRDTIVGRIRDLVRNSGWASGAVTRELDSVIGSRLRLSAKPDYKAVGLDADWAREFGRQIEAHWRLWAYDPRRFCDAARHTSIPGLFGQGYRHATVDGDGLGVLYWLPDRGGRYATTLQIVDPDRLSNPLGMMETNHLRGGVERDEYGAAVAYHFRKAHPYDWFDWGGDRYQWERVERETPWGRPRVVHFFDKQRAGQTRGVSRFTAVVEPFKMLNQYSRVELQAAVINAILGAWIETASDRSAIVDSIDPDNAMALTEYRQGYYNSNPVTFGGARIPILSTGDKVNVLQSARPASGYADFEAACLRNISAATGQSYEQVSNDWSKVNYSSARAALIEVWRSLSSRREAFGDGFCTPIYAAFVEEQVMTGRIELPPGTPDFHDAMAAYCRCKWIGPGRGWVDPLKEAQAAELRMQLGLSTLEDEVAEQGGDWEENIEQLAREIEAMPLGVMHPAQKEFLELRSKQATEPAREAPQ